MYANLVFNPCCNQLTTRNTSHSKPFRCAAWRAGQCSVSMETEAHATCDESGAGVCKPRPYQTSLDRFLNDLCLCAMDLPQKRYYRQRAHSNPLADHTFEYPVSPEQMDWGSLYPDWTTQQQQPVRFLDVGCGYGGLLVELSPRYPDVAMLGLEIRVKVSDYVQDRIRALQHNHPDQYRNIAVTRTNAMKYLPNYFHKGQLSKLFFLFPDPHFKKTKHKWRIINPSVLAEYAYILQEGGLLYTATDVEELHHWNVDHISSHPLFEPLSQKEEEADAILPLLPHCTEEGKKVARGEGQVHTACFRRVTDPYQQTDHV